MTADHPTPWKVAYGGMEGDEYAVIADRENRQVCSIEPLHYVPGTAERIVSAVNAGTPPADSITLSPEESELIGRALERALSEGVRLEDEWYDTANNGSAFAANKHQFYVSHVAAIRAALEILKREGAST